jgi:hypothetical protein
MTCLFYKKGSLVQCPITGILGIVLDVKTSKYSTKYFVFWQEEWYNGECTWNSHYDLIFLDNS